MGSSELGAVDEQQFTIFYSGRVKVFDSVPADKAHAIMLLLSGCSMNRDLSAIKTTASDHALFDEKKMAEKTAPGFPSGYAAGNVSINTIALQQLHRKQQIRAQTKRSRAELPFARKASLARFLEKRKDRVEARQSGGELPADDDTCCKRVKL